MAASQVVGDIDPLHENLIKEVLKQRFGRDVLEIRALSGGRNAFTYQLSVGSETGSTVTMPQPATSSLPASTTKLVMRMSDPDAMLNELVRVQNEAAAMMLAREALASLPNAIVPAVYGWNRTVLESDQSERHFTPGWVLMEFIHGSRLHDKWDSLSSTEKRDILQQLAVIFQKLQAYQLPDSIEGYGGLNFDDDGNVVVGPTAIWGGGPCTSYVDLYVECLQTQLAFAEKCDVVKAWKGSGLRSRIVKFANEGLKPLLLQAESDSALRPTLVHGDFDIHNVLFDEESNRITALLDWDFAHIASQCEEYFYSFDRIGGLLSNPVRAHKGFLALRQSQLHGFSPKDAKRTDRYPDWKTAVMLDEEFAKAGVERPQDIAGIGQLSAVYWFVQHVSPGEFFIKAWRARNSPEDVERIRKMYRAKVERDLAGWGF